MWLVRQRKRYSAVAGGRRGLVKLRVAEASFRYDEGVESRNPAARYSAQALISLSGVWLLFLAVRADDAWILRHVVLPNWFIPPTSLRGFHLARAAIALFGLFVLGVLGPKVGRWAGSQSGKTLAASCVRIAAALFFAVIVSELVVRNWDSEPFGRKTRLEFGLGRPDPRFGWLFVPSHSTLVKNRRAKPVHYNIDAWGNRARSELSAPDPALPTLLVGGESIAFGHGLEYEETFAAILGERLGLQVVNVASGGYGMDQAYLRLIDTLERLRDPVVVLTVFHPVQLGRALQDFRPRLVLRSDKLVLEPAASGFWSRSKLRDLWVNELPYLSEEALAKTMALNAAIIQATSAAARARGAEPLFLVFSFGPARSLDEHREAFIVRELFEQLHQPYLLIDVDRDRIMLDEWHPDAIAAREIAATAERALRPRLKALGADQSSGFRGGGSRIEE